MRHRISLYMQRDHPGLWPGAVKRLVSSSNAAILSAALIEHSRVSPRPVPRVRRIMEDLLQFCGAARHNVASNAGAADWRVDGLVGSRVVWSRIVEGDNESEIAIRPAPALGTAAEQVDGLGAALPCQRGQSARGLRRVRGRMPSNEDP